MKKRIFFNNNYSDYSLEQITNEAYEKICIKFLSMVDDEEIKEKMKRNTI